MMMEPLINTKGITVRELKEWIKNLPEIDQDGDPYEVWQSTGRNLSSPTIFIGQLNRGDIIFECNNQLWKVRH